jgi:predicted RNA-binding protein
MCQAKVYLDGNQIMEDVIWLEPTQDGFLLRSLFDDAREVKGRLEGIDLLKHQVRLTSAVPNEPPRGEP